MIQFQYPPDDKIIVFGMSCCGKTTFATQFTEHHYYCFDAMFYWHQIEVLGGSIKQNLLEIQKQCNSSKFILDGWSLADPDALLLPQESVIYVVYTTYNRIIDQYRIAVIDREEHRSMFNKWYEIDYEKIPKVRFFRNDGDFFETNLCDFHSCVK